MSAVAAAVMADQSLDSRITRLGSDVAHIRSDIADLKLDVRDLRREMADLRDRLTRGLASNRIWMLLQSAAILGVMARGFKWL